MAKTAAVLGFLADNPLQDLRLPGLPGRFGIVVGISQVDAALLKLKANLELIENTDLRKNNVICMCKLLRTTL